jgi:hypothetical protein
VSRAADKAAAALNITSLFLRRHVMRPVLLEVGTSFALAAGHCRIAISFVAGTLNSTLAFSMALVICGAKANGFAFRFFAMPALSAGTRSCATDRALSSSKASPSATIAGCAGAGLCSPPAEPDCHLFYSVEADTR